MAANPSERKYTFRCSTVFVSEGDDTFVFRSLEEMPSSLRQKVLSGARDGAATIFIANRGGRDELARRLRGLPSRVRTRLERNVAQRAEPAVEKRRKPRAVDIEPPVFGLVTPPKGIAGGHFWLVLAGSVALGTLLAYWR